MRLIRSTDPFGSESASKSFACSDCGDCSECDAALSLRCLSCERAERARQAAADPLASQQLKGWLGSDLHPPK